jgi:AcrR family transcriptional regulator
MAAAHCLLREEGSAGCTIEAVALRSGVAKTTIYRQFTDREDLIFAVMETMKPPTPVTRHGGVVADIEAALQDLARDLQEPDVSCMITAMLELAERSHRAAQLAVEFGKRRRRMLAERIRAAVDEGEIVLSDAVDADMLVAQLVGPLFYLRYLARQPISKRFVGRLVSGTFEPLLVAGRVDVGTARHPGA